MSFLISDLKNRVEPKLHGTTINKVGDFYGLCLEAAGNVLLKIDPRETIRIQQITNALYDQVYEYVAPTDLKGDAIIDIRPQVSRSVSDKFSQFKSEEFDVYKSNGGIHVQNNSGVKTLRLSKSLSNTALLDDANSLTDNGTWSAGGNAINFAADSLNYVTGSASLKFDISASGSTAYIENSTITAVDLTNYVNTGAVFVWVYIPSTSIITSVDLRWGSDSSNYYNRTVTATQDNTALVTGWNLLRFDWSGSTQTGTPVTTAIDYVRVTFNYSGTATTSCRVDNIIVKLGSIYNIQYYSKYLFQNSSGTWIEKPTADTDVINLDTESYNIFFYELMELVAQEIQAEDASFDVDFWKSKKKDVWETYMQANKSERKKVRSTYYRIPVKRRR